MRGARSRNSPDVTERDGRMGFSPGFRLARAPRFARTSSGVSQGNMIKPPVLLAPTRCGLPPRDPLTVWCRRPSFRRLSFACNMQCDVFPETSHENKSAGRGRDPASARGSRVGFRLARGGGRGPDDGDQPVGEPDREVPAGGGKGDGGGEGDAGRPGVTEVEHPARVGTGRGVKEPGGAVQRAGGDPVTLRPDSARRSVCAPGSLPSPCTPPATI